MEPDSAISRHSVCMTQRVIGVRMFRACRQNRPITSKSMSSNWPIYGAKSPMTTELVRVVADRPKENPEARDLRGLGGLASCRQSGSNCLRRAPSYQPDHPGSLRTGLQLPLGSSMGDLIARPVRPLDYTCRPSVVHRTVARQVRPKGCNCPSVVHLTN